MTHPSLLPRPRIQHASDNHGNGNDPFNNDGNAQIGKPHVTNTKRMNGRWRKVNITDKISGSKIVFSI